MVLPINIWYLTEAGQKYSQKRKGHREEKKKKAEELDSVTVQVLAEVG